MDNSQKKILYVQYTNPVAFPPLENSSRVLADKAWHVKFIGTEALGFENIQLPSHKNIQTDLMPFCHPSFKQKIHYVRFVLKCLEAIATGNYSCIYISDLFACPVGWFAVEFLGAKVFYHEHDTPEAPKSLFMSFLHWTRKQLSSRAELCIFPQVDRAKIFTENFSGAHVQICHNMPLRSSLRAESSDNQDFKLWYHGSVVPGRLPQTVVEALALLPSSVSLHFAGYETLSSKGYIQGLLDLAQKLGLEDRVVYYGVLARDPLFEMAQKCQLGLCLFKNPFTEPMIGASNKPFDYLACGLPLLINSSSEWVNFFEKPGYAQSCDPEDVQSIAREVESLLKDRAKLTLMKENGLKKIKDEWNYESQFAPIEQRLEKVSVSYQA
jgi:glycosyltransferase involved in cell wall biosynthesis